MEGAHNGFFFFIGSVTALGMWALGFLIGYSCRPRQQAVQVAKLSDIQNPDAEEERLYREDLMRGEKWRDPDLFKDEYGDCQ